eukprot:TRINITY_DN4738_c0_g1_i1.p1 TRINITY_DN4738_c0_g1~~TRINITY_DN4738_c0_g1_i1.p1  ORF type:complete len:517 (+),score=89.42 TRINITY_DN4738_c0_g1_i1:352-1902(+)
MMYNSYITSINYKVHYAPIRKNFIYESAKASSELERNIDILISNIKDGKAPASSLDEYIQKDYSGYLGEYRIYVINSKYSGNKEYSYHQGEGSCDTFLGVGKHDRYAWIDIGAAKKFVYGYNTYGTSVSINLDFPKQNDKSHMIVKIANILMKGIDHLIIPSLHHIPTFEIPELKIHKIHYYEDRKNDGIWDKIKDELEEFIPKEEKVSFDESDFDINQCVECSSILYLSTKAQSTLITTDAGFIQQTNKYIDTDALAEYIQKLPNYEEGVVYVYILDLLEDYTLDSGSSNVVVKENIIIAIDSETLEESDLTCNGIKVRYTDITKPILDGILQIVWGIGRIESNYDMYSGTENEDLTWSLYDYPFKKYGQLDEMISFRERDALMRNYVYNEITISMKKLHTLFKNFAMFHRHLDNALSNEELSSFVKRWSLLEYKINKSKQLIAIHKYDQSYYFAKSLSYDVDEMHEIIHNTAEKFESILTCNIEQTSLKTMRVFAIVSTICMTLIYIFRNKLWK